MKMMAKAQRPTAGAIAYNGTDIFSRDNMLDRFGIMIQPVFLPNISAKTLSHAVAIWLTRRQA